MVDLNLGIQNEHGFVSAEATGGLLYITDQFENAGKLTLHFAAGYRSAGIHVAVTTSLSILFDLLCGLSSIRLLSP